MLGAFLLAALLCCLFQGLFFSHFYLLYPVSLKILTMFILSLPISPSLLPQSMKVDQYIHTCSVRAVQAAYQILYRQSFFITVLNVSTKKKKKEIQKVFLYKVVVCLKKIDNCGLACARSYCLQSFSSPFAAVSDCF